MFDKQNAQPKSALQTHAADTTGRKLLQTTRPKEVNASKRMPLQTSVGCENAETSSSASVSPQQLPVSSRVSSWSCATHRSTSAHRCICMSEPDLIQEPSASVVFQLVSAVDAVSSTKTQIKGRVRRWLFPKPVRRCRWFRTTCRCLLRL